MKYISYLFLLVVLFISCNEDHFDSFSIEEGKNVKVRLNISVPDNNIIDLTRAGVEDDLYELALFCYRLNPNPDSYEGEVPYLYKMIDVTSNLKKSESGYEITEFEMLSGEYYIYAIANWSNAMSPLNLQTLEKELSSKEAMDKYIYSVGVESVFLGGRSLLMSGRSKNATEIIGRQNITDLSISLKRSVAKIEFAIKSTVGKFTPSSYSIYNIPKSASIIQRSNVSSHYSNGDFYNIESLNITGGSFTFFMPENVYDKQDYVDKDGVKSASTIDRELWKEGSDNSKAFINAPATSTYLVLYGYYEGDNPASYSGNVSYTIHLGDFSASGSVDDYNVLRNYNYKYNVDVKGVNSIVVEANRSDEVYNQGAEGIVSSTGNSFLLDAHYEAVYFTISNKDIDKNKEYKLFISTPFEEDTLQIKFENKDVILVGNATDYNWVKFKSCSKDAIATFDNSVMDITGFCKEIATNNANKTLYYTAFVDEYYYDELDWSKFVNKPNRVFALSKDVNISVDGNSICLPSTLLSISQRSIQTTYTYGEDVNAFGVESVVEVGERYLGYTYNKNFTNYSLGSSTTDGWSNTRSLLDNTSSNSKITSYYDKPAMNGWFSYNTHNYNSALNDNTDNNEAPARKSCMTRNRPADGNHGQIKDSDLKWYIPAYDQLLYLWLGEDVLSNEARLYNSEQYTPASDLYTSTGANKRIFKAGYGVSSEDYNSSSEPKKYKVRCVRNLKPAPIKGNTNVDKAYVYDSNTKIFEIKNQNSKICREYVQDGEYISKHKERSSENRIPKKFKVAKEDLVTFTDRFVNRNQCKFTKNGSDNYTHKFVFNDVVEPLLKQDGFKIIYCADDPAYYNRPDRDTYNVPTPIISLTEDRIKNTTNTRVNLYILLKDNITKFRIFEFYGNFRYNHTGNYTGITTLNTKPEVNDAISIYITADDIYSGTPCIYYYEETGGADIGKWRIPNQKELAIMASQQYFGTGTSDPLKTETTSSTVYTGSENLFWYSGGVMQLNTNEKDTKREIRCVRDVN